MQNGIYESGESMDNTEFAVPMDPIYNMAGVNTEDRKCIMRAREAGRKDAEWHRRREAIMNTCWVRMEFSSNISGRCKRCIKSHEIKKE